MEKSKVMNYLISTISSDNDTIFVELYKNKKDANTRRDFILGKIKELKDARNEHGRNEYEFARVLFCETGLELFYADNVSIQSVEVK